MRCRYLSSGGLCTGRYQGYACIKRHCVHFKQAQACEHHDETGDYCRKYARFGCVGKDSCGTLAEYLEAVAAEG